MTGRFTARTLAVYAALIVLAAFPAAAQIDHSTTCTVTGRVETGGVVLSGDYSLVFENPHSHSATARIPIAPNGDFEANQLPTGEYNVQVVNQSGGVLYERMVVLSPFNNNLNIQLRSSADRTAQPVTGTVSLAQLQRKIPPKAYKEFVKAEKAEDAGDLEGSIAHLKKAIEIHPAYMEAYNNLAVRYIKLNQPQLAIDALQKAIEIDQNSEPAYSNLSVACFMLQRLPDAEKAARQAVKLDGNDHRAHLMLGVILASQRKNDSEALENLRAAEKQFPKAHVTIAQVLDREGQRKSAANELKRYLDSGAAENPQQVQTWISQLEASARAEGLATGEHGSTR